MPFSSGVFTRTDGTRSGSDVFVQQKNSAVPVTAALLDNEANDMATGLSTCMLKDGTQTPTANIPMATFKFTGLGAGTARTDSATVGNIQDGSFNQIATAGGTANALTLAPSPAITAYATGQRFIFGATAINTGATTVNVSSVGAVAIVKRTGIGASGLTALTGGEIQNDGGYMEIVYNGSSFTLMNPCPSWSTWTPTFTGFSSDPTGVVARYKKEGTTVTCSVFMSASSGTSNANGFTVSAPFTARTVAGHTWGNASFNAYNNSIAQSNASGVQIASGGTAFVLTLSASTTSWINSGGKSACFTITYEAAS